MGLHDHMQIWPRCASAWQLLSSAWQLLCNIEPILSNQQVYLRSNVHRISIFCFLYVSNMGGACLSLSLSFHVLSVRHFPFRLVTISRLCLKVHLCTAGLCRLETLQTGWLSCIAVSLYIYISFITLAPYFGTWWHRIMYQICNFENGPDWTRMAPPGLPILPNEHERPFHLNHLSEAGPNPKSSLSNSTLPGPLHSCTTHALPHIPRWYNIRAA